MAKGLWLVITLSILSVVALGGAIAVTYLATQKCNFVVNFTQTCQELVTKLTLCCKSCNLWSPDYCTKPNVGFYFQHLSSLGIFMIILMWIVFAALTIFTIVIFIKFKKASGQRLLG